MYTPVHGCIQMHLHMCVYVEARGQPQVLFFKLRQALSFSFYLELFCSSRLAGHQALGISTLHLPRAGLEGCCHAWLLLSILETKPMFL